MVNASRSIDSRAGNSKLNDYTARLCVRLALELSEYGVIGDSVMILTPYKAQVNYIQALLTIVSIEQNIKMESLLRVMSCGSALGHTTGVVILDLVSTKTAGFIFGDFKLEGSWSRAQVGVITVGNYTRSKTWPNTSKWLRYREFIEEMDMVVEAENLVLSKLR